MRTLRTVIMGFSMALPGMFLALIIWYIAGKPSRTSRDDNLQRYTDDIHWTWFGLRLANRWRV